MITKTPKPFSFTTKDGKTEYFRSGAEIAGWIAKHRPQYLVDMNKGIDYSQCDSDKSENLTDIYEYNDSFFRK